MGPTDSYSERNPNGLISPDEPPAVSLLNEHGSGNVLLVGDHVSNRIPRSLRQLGVEDRVLQKHVAYDIGTRPLLTHLVDHLNAMAVIAGYSRLVVDLNRSLEDPTLIPEVSDTIPIPGNRNLSREDRARRVHCFYTPYRSAIDRALQGFRARGIVPAFIAVHSFTPQMAGTHRPWHIGLLWDTDPRIPVPLLQRLRAHPAGLQVGDNQPYSGKHPADYTIDHHAEAAGLPHVSIEVRQDLIDSEAGAEQWAVVLAEALNEILADRDLYKVWDAV